MKSAKSEWCVDIVRSVDVALDATGKTFGFEPLETPRSLFCGGADGVELRAKLELNRPRIVEETYDVGVRCVGISGMDLT